MNKLIDLSRNSENEWLRCNSSWSLLQIDPAHPQAINTLVEIVSNSQDEVLLWNLNLERIGTKSLKLLRTLLRTSYAGKTEEIRITCAAELFSIFARDTKILNTFFKVLKIRKSVLNLLNSKDKTPEKGVECIKYIINSVDNIQTSEDKKIRRDRVLNLVKFLVDQPKLTKLIFELGNQFTITVSGKEHISALFKLLEIDIALLVPIWLDLVNSVIDDKTRAILARGITNFGLEDKRVTAKLEYLIHNTEEDREHIRRWLAEGLMKIDPENPVMLSTFLDLLKNSKSWDTCLWVSISLGELCNENPSVINILIDLMETTEERRISDNIALGLREIFQLDVLKIVVEKLKDFLDRDTREQNFTLYKNAFEVLWHCAERLPYGEFYKIWHGQPALTESGSE